MLKIKIANYKSISFDLLFGVISIVNTDSSKTLERNLLNENWGFISTQ